MSASIETLKAKTRGPRAAKIAVRMAIDEEGERIEELVKAAGFRIDGIDWSKIAPFWLVATWSDQIVGCIQTCLALPIGRLEMLAVDERVPPITRGAIVEQLMWGGAATVKQFGAQMVTSMVSFNMKGYKKSLRHRGCVSIGTGNMMAMMLK